MSRDHYTRSYAVRLAIRRDDYSAGATYVGVYATDADHATALAIAQAEEQSGRTGWVLDGPTEEEPHPCQSAARFAPQV